MLELVLMCLLVAAVAGDVYLSRRRVLKYGIGVEGNNLAVWAIKRFGVTAGLVAAIWLPTAVLLALAMNYLGSVGVALLTGAKLHRAVLQIESLPLEAAMDKALASAKSKAGAVEQKAESEAKSLWARVKAWFR